MRSPENDGADIHQIKNILYELKKKVDELKLEINAGSSIPDPPIIPIFKLVGISLFF